MKIAIDITNGDNSPHSNINGAINYYNNNGNSKIFLVGTSEDLNIAQKSKYKHKFEYIEANQLIEHDDRPSRIIKNKPNSSLVKSIDLLKNKYVDAVISSGNTGCLLAASLFKIGKLRQIKRPALATFIPINDKGFVLCDVGANSDNKPSHLLQFALMAKSYIKYLENINSPRVGLLNIGKESNKGNDLYLETYKLLTDHFPNFIGNIESRYLFDNRADVIVCDGFTGNVILKLIEGFIANLSTWVTNDLKNKENANSSLKNIIKSFDYEEYGATPLLGIDGIVLKCHGSSNEKAFENAILKAEKCINNNFLDEIKNSLNKIQI